MGKNKDLKPEDFGEFYYSQITEKDSDEINRNFRFVDLWRSLGFHLKGYRWQKHRNMFYENIIQVKNEIQKPFNMGIIQNAYHLRKIFEMDKYIAPNIHNNE